MGSVSLTTLRARALDRASLDTYTEDRLDEHLNTGLALLHDVMAQLDPDSYLTKQVVTMIAGTESYALDALFMRAHKVFYFPDAQHRYPVKRWNFSDHQGKKTSPVAAGNVEIWYIPQFTELAAASDTTTANLPSGSEEYAVLHAAIQMRDQEESEVQVLMMERERCLTHLKNTYSPRDTEEDSVEDVYRWNDLAEGYDYYWNDRPSLRYRIIGSNITFLEGEWSL